MNKQFFYLASLVLLMTTVQANSPEKAKSPEKVPSITNVNPITLLPADDVIDSCMEKAPQELKEKPVQTAIPFDSKEAHHRLFGYAQTGNCVEIEKLFKEASGKLNLNIKKHYYNSKGKISSTETPLSIAVKNHQSTAVKILCTLGANVDKLTGFGWNYLHIAVNNNDFAIAQVLLEAKIKRNVQTAGFESTALHFAAQNGSLDMINLLLDYGVLDLPNMDGQTAIFTAIKHSHPEIAMTLAMRINGALSHRDNNGQTPLQFAYTNRYFVHSALRNLASAEDREIIIKKEVHLPKVPHRKPAKRTLYQMSDDGSEHSSL